MTTTDTTYRQATDDEVIAWAAESWREGNEDEPIDVEGFTDVSVRFGEAIQATYDHDVEHLIQDVSLWIVAGNDGTIDGFLITIDLPNKLRLSSLVQDYHHLIPRDTPGDAESVYRKLLGNVLRCARSLIHQYAEARGDAGRGALLERADWYESEAPVDPNLRTLLNRRTAQELRKVAASL